MVIDVPLTILQRRFAAKYMLGVANAMMLIATVIFLYFVLTASDIKIKLGYGIWELTKTFLSSGINIFFLGVVGILYGTIKEVYDIVTLSYLLNTVPPKKYDQALSKNSIATGIGSVVGIVLSAIILSFKTNSVDIILFFLLFFIVISWVFIALYFDNDSSTFEPNTISQLHLRTLVLEK